MITKNQATAVKPDTQHVSLWPWLYNDFHASHPTKPGECQNWRRNGKTQTWKRSPERFRIPVKSGLYDYGAIDETSNDQLYVAEKCLRCRYPVGMAVIYSGDGKLAEITEHLPDGSLILTDDFGHLWRAGTSEVHSVRKE